MGLPPLFSPDQWTPAELDFARTFITGFSALVAFASACIAWLAQRAQRRHVRSERRFVAYRLVVLEPAKQILADFQNSALTALSKGRDELGELKVKDVQISVLDSCGRNLVEDFNRWYYKSSGELVDAAKAWGDLELTTSLTEQFADLQDDVIASCNRMRSEDIAEPPVDLVLRQHVSAILSTLVHHEVDPQPRRLGKAVQWVWRQLRRERGRSPNA
jgi:hypothetical protein